MARGTVETEIRKALVEARRRQQARTKIRASAAKGSVRITRGVAPGAKRRGRPPKVKVEPMPVVPKRRGRPPGSKNKKPGVEKMAVKVLSAEKILGSAPVRFPGMKKVRILADTFGDLLAVFNEQRVSSLPWSVVRSLADAFSFRLRASKV